MRNPNRLSMKHVRLNVFNWIKSQIGEGVLPEALKEDQVIWRNQSEPLPARPCVALKFITGPIPHGTTDFLQYDGTTEDPKYNIGGQRSMVLNVQVFGLKLFPDVAGEIARELHSSLFRLSVTERLRAGIMEAGKRKGVVAVWSVGDVADISSVEETEYEERHSFDVTIGVAENIEDRPGVIEHVNYTVNTV